MIGCALAGTCLAQTGPSAIDFANLHEDVRALSERVDDLRLRVEQLEQKNRELEAQIGASGQGYATVVQLNQAVDDLNNTIRSAVATSQDRTLHKVAGQMEKLANQMNAALASLAKAQAVVPVGSAAAPVPAGARTYTVQKGDTLAAIARKTGVRERALIAANKISDPSRIVVGQILVIPTSPSSAAK